MKSPARRRALRWGCGQCLGLAALCGGAGAQQPAAGAPGWQMPERFPKPELASDEGGLWALMDREETRLRRSPMRLRDAALEGLVTRLACKLAGEHCIDVRVYVMRQPLFNASMAPNGMLQLWSGLLLRLDNEAQLASVIGHEIGHYLQRHTLERLRDQRMRGGFASFIALFGLVGLVGQLALIAGAYGFSREHEREADRIGLALMRAQGYETREAARIWALLLEELRATPGNDPAKESVLFATHPHSAEREAQLRELATADAPGHTGEAAWKAVIKPLRPQLLEDELRRAHPHETIALMDRLLAREANDGWLLCTRGEARRRRAGDQDLPLALEDFTLAAAQPEAPPVAHRGRGDSLLALNRPAEAKAAWATYLERAPQAVDAALVRQLMENTPS